MKQNVGRDTDCDTKMCHSNIEIRKSYFWVRS